MFLSAIAAFKSIGKHCLIVGDPMQLPPIVLGADKIQYKLWKVQQQCDGLSAFALGTDIKSYRITTTFRLTPRSASQTALFYGESFRSVQKERLDFGEIQSSYFPKDGGCILAYSQSGTDSVCSKGALSIMHYVVDQIASFYPEREVAIITPFKDTIKVLQKEFYTENQQLDITVETIDRIQGMTVDYAIVYFPMCNISFALSENRFNVATSRSRSTTLIISDLDFKVLSSVPRKSLRFLDTCEMHSADSVKPIGKPIASETPKTQTESATVISSGDMSVKVLGTIDLSKFERKKVEIVEDKENLYIIDTNVFVNCPEIISKIDKKYPVVLSAKVIDELDKLKIKLDASGVQNVQKALRSINYQMTQRDVRMELSDPSLLPADFDRRSPDNMILTVALKYKSDRYNPILLTSDNGLQIKARGLGITTISLKDILKK